MHGAVTVLNATATGIGCALAVEGGVEATWTWGGDGAQIEGAPDDRLVRAVAQLAALRMERPVRFQARTASRWPPARGLKTSSAAAAALLLAAWRAAGRDVSAAALVGHAVVASRQAGVTITGALDDQLAVVHGGCRLADNLAGRDLGAIPVPRWHVAVWVPAASIAKAQAAGVELAAAVPKAKAAEAMARRGDIAGAMAANGALYARAYAAAGLPVDERPAEAARQAGAVAAGLSGTGPAVAALFDTPAAIAPVPGGRWEWTRVAHAPAEGHDG